MGNETVQDENTVTTVRGEFCASRRGCIHCANTALYLRSSCSKQQQKSVLNHFKQNCSTPIHFPSESRSATPRRCRTRPTSFMSGQKENESSLICSRGQRARRCGTNSKLLVSMCCVREAHCKIPSCTSRSDNWSIIGKKTCVKRVMQANDARGRQQRRTRLTTAATALKLMNWVMEPHTRFARQPRADCENT
jgi:hypothetical protein